MYQLLGPGFVGKYLRKGYYIISNLQDEFSVRTNMENIFRGSFASEENIFNYLAKIETGWASISHIFRDAESIKKNM